MPKDNPFQLQSALSSSFCAHQALQQQFNFFHAAPVLFLAGLGSGRQEELDMFVQGIRMAPQLTNYVKRVFTWKKISKYAVDFSTSLLV